MNILQLEYVPEEILHREEQMREMTYLFKQPLLDRPPENILIYGRSGTGKTMTILQMTKYLKQECNRRSINNIHTFYINCSKAKTPITIVKRLCQQVGIRESINDSEELMIKFLKKIDETKNYIIIILDEIDKLKHDQDKDWVIRYLVRAREGYQFGTSSITNSSIGLICIVNDTRFAEKLNVGTMESFGKTHIIRFPAYTEKQLYDILKVRADRSLEKNSISDKLIHELAKYSKDLNAEARTAIQLLRESAIIAEQKNTNKITVDNIITAKQKIEANNIFNDLRDLSKHEKWAFLSLLFTYPLMMEHKKIKDIAPSRASNGESILTQTSTIYSIYKSLLKRYGNQSIVCERQFRRYFTETFNNQGLIESKSIGKIVVYAPTIPVTTATNLLLNELVTESNKINNLLPQDIIIQLLNDEDKEINEIINNQEETRVS